MNSIISSRLSGLALVLLISLFFMGCTRCQLCVLSCMNVHPGDYPQCAVVCGMSGCPFPFPAATDNVKEYQQALDAWLEASEIEFCEEYPDECQEAFEAWLEASG